MPLKPAKPGDPRPLCLVVRAAQITDWQCSSDLTGELKDGVFQGRILKPTDPFLLFRRASASLQSAPSVRTRVRITGQRSATLYFGTKAKPWISADTISDRFPLVGDGAWHEYTVAIENPIQI